MARKATKKTTWILICDASRARLLREEPKGGYVQVDDFEHVESRAHARDLMADAQGRKPNGTSGGMGLVSAPGMGTGTTYLGRPGAAPDTDPKEVEAQKFARMLADRLEKSLNEHEFESLVVVAPPQFLGLIKSTVSVQVSKRIEETIDKDFSWLEPRDLEARLRQLRAA